MSSYDPSVQVYDSQLLPEGNVLQVFNVHQYGAKGDGVTDDSVAFQHAANAAGFAGGGIMWIPATPQHYAGTTTITVPASVTVWVANGTVTYPPLSGGAATVVVSMAAYVPIVGSSAIPPAGVGGGSHNMALGSGALATAGAGPNSIGIGYTALAALAGGGSETAVGAYAGAALIDGGANTLVGTQAGQQLTHGEDNVFIGAIAANAVTGTLGTTSQNVVIGSTSVGAATALQSCTIIGAGAVTSGLAPGPNTVAIGDGALQVMSGDGGGNTVVGHFAGASVTIGGTNVLIGDQAGYNGGTNPLTTGSDNVIIGTVAGLSGATQPNAAIAIGRAALVGGSNAIAIGHGAQATAPGSVAIGCDHTGAAAATNVQDQILIGTANQSVQFGGALVGMSAASASFSVEAPTGQASVLLDGQFGCFVRFGTGGAPEWNVANTGGGLQLRDLVNSVNTLALTPGSGINGAVTAGGVFFPVQAATASAPTYVKGGVYFDTTLNKMRVGGATAWETVTSS